MGLIYGTGSFTRFMIGGDLPENYLEEFPSRISRFAFRDIDEASEQEQSYGWVNILDMFDNRFSSMEYLKEPCIALSWRFDQRRVPAKALLRYCREAEEIIKASEGREYLSKTRRREIKEEVRLRLLKRAIPRSHTYDMIWNLHTGVLIFGSTSNRLCDEFSEFFFECFGLNLKTVHPYTLASQILEIEGISPDILEDLKAQALSNEFLGREFLLWLWFRCETSESGFDLGEGGHADLWPDRKIVLQEESDKGLEKITCSGENPYLREARFALTKNKDIIEVMVKLIIDSSEWSFILDSTWFNFKSFKTPKVLLDKDQDPEGMFFEKYFLIDKAVTTINTIYSSFIKIRITPEWERNELPAMLKWIRQEK